MRADKFIELVKRHTEFTEFSASLLNEFVEKIIVHEAAKVNGVREQEVEIYLNFIGKLMGAASSSKIHFWRSSGSCR